MTTEQRLEIGADWVRMNRMKSMDSCPVCGRDNPTETYEGDPPDYDEGTLGMCFGCAELAYAEDHRRFFEEDLTRSSALVG